MFLKFHSEFIARGASSGPMPTEKENGFGLQAIVGITGASSEGSKSDCRFSTCIVVARKLEHHYPHALKVNYKES